MGLVWYLIRSASSQNSQFRSPIVPLRNFHRALIPDLVPIISKSSAVILIESFATDLLPFPLVFSGEPPSSTIQGTSTGRLTCFWSSFCWLRDTREPLFLCCCCPLLPNSMSDFDIEMRDVEDGRVLPRGGESSWSPRGLSEGRQTALLEPLLCSSTCVFL